MDRDPINHLSRGEAARVPVCDNNDLMTAARKLTSQRMGRGFHSSLPRGIGGRNEHDTHLRLCLHPGFA